MNGLTGAKGMVLIMAERHPEKSGPLTRFVVGLNDAQEELIRSVRPACKGDVLSLRSPFLQTIVLVITLNAIFFYIAD
jgi:hypothetical protein